jgi:membrane-associated phospholipid phosphatase
MPSSYNANNGNNANSGNASGAGNASSVSAGWFFPDRVNLPFVTTPDTGPGKLVPPLPPIPVGDLPLIAIPRFPDRNWSTEWYAWLALAEFAGTAWQANLRPTAADGWPAVAPTPANLPATPPDLDWTALTPAGEVADLVTAAENERADAMGEILSQSDEFISYFLNMMSARPASHPHTTQVLAIASLVGTLVAMYLKALYARPRPSQLCPALLPPVEVPGHASFPSGHSTQAHLMALCMADVLMPPPARAVQRGTTVDGLWTLADRIARNREIAGLHYFSDSAAGAAVARATLRLLRTDVAAGHNLLPPNPAGGPLSCYLRAVAGAQEEWP